MGVPCAFSFSRKPGVKPDNAGGARGHEEESAAGAVRLVQRAHVRGRARRPRRLYSRRRFPAPSSGGPPARPSWAMPARPISFRNIATRCSTRCFNILPLGVRDGQGRSDAGPAGTGRRPACGTRMPSIFWTSMSRPSRSWCGFRRRSDCASASSSDATPRRGSPYHVAAGFRFPDGHGRRERGMMRRAPHTSPCPRRSRRAGRLADRGGHGRSLTGPRHPAGMFDPLLRNMASAIPAVRELSGNG